MDLELSHKLQFIVNGLLSFYAICFSLKNLLYFETTALPHWLLFWEKYWIWFFSTQAQSSQSFHRKIKEVSSKFTRLQREEIVNGFHHFIDPRHCELKELCTHTHRSWSWLSRNESHPGLGIVRHAIPTCHTPELWSNNFENKFLQYDT